MTFKYNNRALHSNVEGFHNRFIAIEIERQHRVVLEFWFRHQPLLNRLLRFARWAPRGMNDDHHRLPVSSQRVKYLLVVSHDLPGKCGC